MVSIPWRTALIAEAWTLVPLQTLCEAPGGESLLGAMGGLIQGVLVVVGVVSLAIGLMYSRSGGSHGSAEGRKRAAYGIFLLAAGLLFFELIGWIGGDIIGVGLADAGVGCMAGG